MSRSLRADHKNAVDLAGDVAFQAPDDLTLRLSLGKTLAHVGLRRLMPPEPHHHDPVESRVGLAIASSVQSMPLRLAGRSWQRLGAERRPYLVRRRSGSAAKDRSRT